MQFSPTEMQSAPSQTY